MRGRVALNRTVETTDITITRRRDDAEATIRTTASDPESLRDAMARVEEALSVVIGDKTAPPGRSWTIDDPGSMLHPALWSEPTATYDAEARTTLVESLIAPANSAGMLSAGTVRTTTDAHMTVSANGQRRYYPTTTVECSMTVRDPKGTASGWAGINHYDLTKIDPAALASRALTKCQASANPRAVEPGRYTVILEPQATADLVSPLIGGFGAESKNTMGRWVAEVFGYGPFGRKPGVTRIGEYVIDRRLDLRSDPMDPDGGFIPYTERDGAPYRPVTWIERGMLKALSYDYYYGLTRLHTDVAYPCPDSYRLSAAPGAPAVSVPDMIAKTERGLLVTRFSGMIESDGASALYTGYTRDGIWLIEHGKISRPVKNLRFRESPLFALNNVLDVGPAERVYAPDKSWIAPALRVDDFAFVGLSDAV